VTRISTKKSVGADYWQGRLAAAQAFRKSAEDAMTLAEAGANMNPAISQMVLAAIAYGDALTAKRANVINQQDHAAAPKLLRDVLGSTLPGAQETRYRRILGNKDAAQYGARHAGRAQAQKLLEDLTEFATWVEDQL
jgi:hypothetical protein